MKAHQVEALQAAAQDILNARGGFEGIGERIDAAAAPAALDPWIQARMRMFPVLAAGAHVIATRGIALCLDKDVGIAGNTVSERYNSLTAAVDERAAPVIEEFRAVNPTFNDAVAYYSTNKDMLCEILINQGDMVRRRGKVTDIENVSLPFNSFVAKAMRYNAKGNTRALLLHDMLRVCVQTGELPSPADLTARARSRHAIFAHLSTLSTQVFGRATLGAAFSDFCKAVRTNNSIDNLSLNFWSEIMNIYLDTGDVPAYAYRLAPSLLVTDA